MKAIIDGKPIKIDSTWIEIVKEVWVKEQHANGCDANHKLFGHECDCMSDHCTCDRLERIQLRLACIIRDRAEGET